MAKKRIGVVLSGCGHKDGSEIQEAALTLFFIDRAGAQAVIMAPNVDQHHVVNHLTGDETDESRNVLVESARIARGDIKDLVTVEADDLDAIILPGGFGAAKNLSSFAFDGQDATVNAALAALLIAVHGATKPIGAICVSPAVISKVFSDQGIKLTIGNDAGTAGAIQKMGNIHQESLVEDIVIDDKNNVISTAAYMCSATISAVGAGIEKLVNEVVARS